MLLLVLWEELDSPLELDVLAEGAVLSLLEVPCEVLSEADVDPEEAPDEAAEELPELLVLPLEELANRPSAMEPNRARMPGLLRSAGCKSGKTCYNTYIIHKIISEK